MEALREIPWLAAVGEPGGPDAKVVRLERWEQWPGPEDELVTELDEMLMARTFALGVRDLGHRPPTRFGGWLDRSRKTRQTFHQARDLVSELASARVLTGPEQDPWHPQTAAVMGARHVAGVVACYRERGLALGELAAIWKWFEAGHWPCGYARHNGKRRLLVL